MGKDEERIASKFIQLKGARAAGSSSQGSSWQQAVGRDRQEHLAAQHALPGSTRRWRQKKGNSKERCSSWRKEVYNCSKLEQLQLQRELRVELAGGEMQTRWCLKGCLRRGACLTASALASLRTHRQLSTQKEDLAPRLATTQERICRTEETEGACQELSELEETLTKLSRSLKDRSASVKLRRNWFSVADSAPSCERSLSR